MDLFGPRWFVGCLAQCQRLNLKVKYQELQSFIFKVRLKLSVKESCTYAILQGCQKAFTNHHRFSSMSKTEPKKRKQGIDDERLTMFVCHLTVVCSPLLACQWMLVVPSDLPRRWAQRDWGCRWPRSWPPRRSPGSPGAGCSLSHGQPPPLGSTGSHWINSCEKYLSF